MQGTKQVPATPIACCTGDCGSAFFPRFFLAYVNCVCFCCLEACVPMCVVSAYPNAFPCFQEANNVLRKPTIKRTKRTIRRFADSLSIGSTHPKTKKQRESQQNNFIKTQTINRQTLFLEVACHHARMFFCLDGGFLKFSFVLLFVRSDPVDVFLWKELPAYELV